MVLAGAEAEANGSRLGGVEWRRGGARGGGWRLRPPEKKGAGEVLASGPVGRRRGPAPGLAGRRLGGGGDVVLPPHGGTWLAAAMCPIGSDVSGRRGGSFF